MTEGLARGVPGQPAAPGIPGLGVLGVHWSSLAPGMPGLGVLGVHGSTNEQAFTESDVTVSEPPEIPEQPAAPEGRPQVRFGAGNQEVRPQVLRPFSPGEGLMELALATAQEVTFPAEALSNDPLGYYANMLRPSLHAAGRQQPDIEVTERNFLDRVSYDGHMIRDSLKPLVQEPEAWGWWGSKLLWCLECKPNLNYRGFVSLTDEEFQNSQFEGRNACYLYHMFEKHKGETIALHTVTGNLVDNPWNVTMHNDQFFTNAHWNRNETMAFWNARQFGKIKNTADDAQKRDFLHRMMAIPNTVYKPADQGYRCQEVTVSYHSLQSLLWECCERYQLMELYTFFCSSEVLTNPQAHCSRGRRGRGKGREREMRR